MGRPWIALIQQLTAAWGRRGSLSDLERIAGPWAVALWQPSSEQFLIVTDPIGVQPLFWARTSDRHVAMSSSLDLLLQEPGVDDSIDYEGVPLDSIPGVFDPSVLHRTRFATVSRVPGRAVIVRRDQRIRVHQIRDPRELCDPDTSLTLADCADLLRDRIDAAARSVVDIGGPIGGHISGGLDCTSISCRVNQLLAESGRSMIAGYSWAPSETDTPAVLGRRACTAR